MPTARPADTDSTTVAIVATLATTIERRGIGAASTMASGFRWATADMPFEPMNAARPMNDEGPQDRHQLGVHPAGRAGDARPDEPVDAGRGGSSFSKSAEHVLERGIDGRHADDGDRQIGRGDDHDRAAVRQFLGEHVVQPWLGQPCHGGHPEPLRLVDRLEVAGAHQHQRRCHAGDGEGAEHRQVGPDDAVDDGVGPVVVVATARGTSPSPGRRPAAVANRAGWWRPPPPATIDVDLVTEPVAADSARANMAKAAPKKNRWTDPARAPLTERSVLVSSAPSVDEAKSTTATSATWAEQHAGLGPHQLTPGNRLCQQQPGGSVAFLAGNGGHTAGDRHDEHGDGSDQPEELADQVVVARSQPHDGAQRLGHRIGEVRDRTAHAGVDPHTQQGDGGHAPRRHSSPWACGRGRSCWRCYRAALAASSVADATESVLVASATALDSTPASSSSR
jgi:hypothetical protein